MIFWVAALVITILLAFGLAGKALQVLARVVLVLVGVVILYTVLVSLL